MAASRGCCGETRPCFYGRKTRVGLARLINITRGHVIFTCLNWFYYDMRNLINEPRDSVTP